ncbi:Der GTPase-activating protein YihI [Colwellia demingiae]|uniref:Der GTPase-activating protein YihI n=1 Tax=Colwellia demingiae TaxID=89401 RepID=A0A5C6QPI0_9GAMM|nr:Der GTPase-activating protein YihI [Colwellia demingiae]TWX70894.1 Der GTPase-activating protein YihI [Colwellia demingiae]
MSRSKKSRKPGGAPTAKPKLSKQELEKVEKRTRKTTGKVAGNRQKEAMPEQTDNNQQGGNKDPRLGNKTPIVLGKIITKAEKAKAEKSKQAKAKLASQKSAPIASIRFVEDTVVENIVIELSPEQELDAIEQDETLQTILAKQEDDTALTEQEVDYYNEKMERHQALSAELGLDEDDDASDSDESNNGDSEDDLWDKLDRPDFSDFEEKE